MRYITQCQPSKGRNTPDKRMKISLALLSVAHLIKKKFFYKGLEKLYALETIDKLSHQIIQAYILSKDY